MQVPRNIFDKFGANCAGDYKVACRRPFDVGCEDRFYCEKYGLIFLQDYPADPCSACVIQQILVLRVVKYCRKLTLRGGRLVVRTEVLEQADHIAVVNEYHRRNAHFSQGIPVKGLGGVIGVVSPHIVPGRVRMGPVCRDG